MLVGRKNQESLERHFNLTAGLKAEKIHAAVHRDNPAVQNFGRSGPLPAEIVDEVNAVIGLELKWRVVDFGDLVIAQIQHADGELSASDDERRGAAHPA